MTVSTTGSDELESRSARRTASGGGSIGSPSNGLSRSRTSSFDVDRPGSGTGTSRSPTGSPSAATSSGRAQKAGVAAKGGLGGPLLAPVTSSPRSAGTLAPKNMFSLAAASVSAMKSESAVTVATQDVAQ